MVQYEVEFVNCEGKQFYKEYALTGHNITVCNECKGRYKQDIKHLSELLELVAEDDFDDCVIVQILLMQ